MSNKIKRVINDSQKYWATKGLEGSIADLSGADLRQLNLRDINLKFADMTSANLQGVNLCGANLEGATLTDVNLHESDLRYANLYGADLSGADLIRADLIGANLKGAVLRGTHMGGGYKPIDPDIFGITPDPELPRKVAQSILNAPSTLNMDHWHLSRSCGTSHCLAGWAIHLSGAAGYALEKATSPSVAGAMLMPSASHLFYCSNGDAVEWAKEQLVDFTYK